MNPVHDIEPNFFRFYIILLFHLQLDHTSDFFPSGSPSEPPVTVSRLSHPCYFRCLYHPWFDLPNRSWLKLWSSLLWNYLYPPSPLRFIILERLHPICSLNLKDQSKQIQGKQLNKLLKARPDAQTKQLLEMYEIVCNWETWISPPRLELTIGYIVSQLNTINNLIYYR